MSKRKPRGYWKTEEGHLEIINLASICKTKQEFRKNYNSAYLAAFERGILEEVCSHMLTFQRKSGYWKTSEGMKEIKNGAKKCQKRSEFERKYPKAYNAALKLNIMDEVCTHMLGPQRKSGYWKTSKGIEEMKSSAASCKTYRELKERYPTAYNAINRAGLLEKFGNHLIYDKAYPPNFWESKMGDIEMKRCASLCSNRDEFRKKFSRAYNTAKKKGILDQVCAELDRVRQIKGYWSSEEGISEIKKIALGYNSRSRFKEEHPDKYIAIRRAGLLENICAHMEFGGFGFDSQSEGYLYVLSVFHPIKSKPFSKIGISNRGAKYRYLGEKTLFNIEKEWVFELGINARDAETRIKQHYSNYQYTENQTILTTGGDSELFDIKPEEFIIYSSNIAEEYGGILV
jgi:hypothetical protein